MTLLGSLVTVDEEHNCPQTEVLPGAMREDVYTAVRIHSSSDEVHREQAFKTASAVREHKKDYIDAEQLSSELIVVQSSTERVMETSMAVEAHSLTSDTRAAVMESSECRDESGQNMALADHQEVHWLTKREQPKRQDETTKHSALQTLRFSAEADSHATVSSRGNAEHSTYDQALTTQSSTKQTTDTSAEVDNGIENGNSNDLITVAKSSGRFGGQISEQTRGQAVGVPILREEDARRVSVQGQVACEPTQGMHESSVQQAAQVATKQTTLFPIELAAQSTSQQTTLTSADLNVGTRHTDSLVVASGSSGSYGGGTLLQKREDLCGSATDQTEWQSAQEVGQSSSVTAQVVWTQEIDRMSSVQPTTQVITEKSMQSISEQNALVSAEETPQTSTEQITQTSTDINVGIGGSDSFSNPAKSSEYGGGTFLQQLGQAACVTSIQAIDDVERRSATCEVARDSTQADGQPSSLQQTTQLSTEKTPLSSASQTAQFIVEATYGTVEDKFDNSVISRHQGGTQAFILSTEMVRAGASSPIVILRDAERCGM